MFDLIMGILSNLNWPVIFARLWFGSWESLATVFLSLLIGGGLALWQNFARVKKIIWFDIIMIMPIFLPPIVVGLGLISIWGNNGLVNQGLNFLGLTPIKFLYNGFSVVLAHCYYNIPLVYLAISLKLSNLHPAFEDSAMVMGASRLKILTAVIWPRLRSAVLAVSALVFLYSFTSFALPLVLGGIKHQTLEVYIYRLFTGQLNFASAISLAIGQTAFLFGLVILFLKKMNYFNESYVNPIQLGIGKKNIKLLLSQIALAIFLLAPLSGLIIMGGRGSGFEANFLFLIRSGFLPAFGRSLALAGLSFIFSILIAGFFLFGRRRRAFWPVLWLSVSPVCFGLIWRWLIGQSLLSAFLAFVLISWPFNFFLLSSYYHSRPSFFYDSLKIMGANNWQMIKATVNYLAPALLKIFCLHLVFVLGDVAISGLVTPYGQPTVMLLNYSLIGSYRFGACALGMSLVLAMILILLLAINLFATQAREMKKFLLFHFRAEE